jgi:uncharacterized membrane protein YbhN (UPF0104 family)
MARPDPDPDPTDREPSSSTTDGLLMTLLDPSGSSRPGRSRLLLAAGSVVLLAVALGWLLPRALDLDLPQILASLGRVPAGVLAAAAVLGVLAVVLEGIGARAALPGAPWGATVRAHSAASAVSLVLPGGSLLGIAVTGTALRRRRVPARTIASGIAAFSVLDLLLGGVAIPLLALLAYGVLGARHELPGSVWALVLAVLGAALTLAVLIVLLHRPTFARLLAALAPALGTVLELTGRRGAQEAPPSDLVLAVRDRVAQMLRRRWPQILAPMVLARLCQFGVLAIAADALFPGAIGATGLPALFSLLGVFLIGRTIALVPVTPGGGGIAETVLAVLLVALGAPSTSAAAASLVLGCATWLVPILLGAALGVVELGFGRGRSRGSAD